MVEGELTTVEDLTERTLETRRLFDGRVLRVRVDTVALPNGETGVREVVEHNGSVVIVPIFGQDVFLVRQYRHATGETLLELPAGTIDAGEDKRDTALRETEEEIGFTPQTLTYLFEGYVSPGYSGELQSFWLAEDLVPVASSADDDEFLDVVTMPLAEALLWVERGDCRDLKTMAGLLHIATRLGLR
jgi:ADP-ribose pyrophosphatase